MKTAPNIENSKLLKILLSKANLDNFFKTQFPYIDKSLSASLC